VRFEDGRSGVVREAVIVYPADANASAGRISVLAPIGSALLGLAVDDTISWPLPDGREARFHTLAVEPPAPTAAAEEVGEDRDLRPALISLGGPVPDPVGP